MKKNMLTTVVMVLALMGCSADFIPFSGGELTGEVVPVPEDWGLLTDIEVIQLETNPDAPYSVKLWAIGMDDIVYVHAGANRAAWVEHMEQNPNVRLKAGDLLYELSAQRVTEQPEFDAFSSVYEVKYGNPPRNGNVKEAYLFRLSGR